MKVRGVVAGDAEKLKAISDTNGFPYPDITDPHIESLMVAEDDGGRILAAVAAKRIVELYLWCPEDASPIAKVLALRRLHEEMGAELKRLGYKQVNCYVPPALEKEFGRRLKRSFGFRDNWNSLYLNL